LTNLNQYNGLRGYERKILAVWGSHPTRSHPHNCQELPTRNSEEPSNFALRNFAQYGNDSANCSISEFKLSILPSFASDTNNLLYAILKRAIALKLCFAFINVSTARPVTRRSFIATGSTGHVGNLFLSFHFQGIPSGIPFTCNVLISMYCMSLLSNPYLKPIFITYKNLFELCGQLRY